MFYAQALKIYDDFAELNLSRDKHPPFDRKDVEAYMNELFKNKNIFERYPTDMVFKREKMNKIAIVRSFMVVYLLANPKDEILSKLFRILEPNSRSRVSKKVI